MRNLVILGVLMGSAAAQGRERKELELVWLDAHRLFPGFARVRSEADAIFRDLGVEVRWEVGTDPRPSTGENPRIQVVLMPSEPTGWGIAPTAMGVVLLPERSRQETAYLFYRAILRNVGLGRKSGAMLEPREQRDVARAIARVLVHEVVHTIVPNLSHADEGVMHDALLSATLLRQDVEIDGRTREEFLRGLEE